MFETVGRLSGPFANVFDNKSITCSDIEHMVEYDSNSRANRVADAERGENRT